MKLVLTVNVIWDDEAKVFVATSEDIPGLATEAETFERLVERVESITPELLRDNNVLPQTSHMPVAFLQSYFTNLRVS